MIYHSELKKLQNHTPHLQEHVGLKKMCDQYYCHVGSLKCFYNSQKRAYTELHSATALVEKIALARFILFSFGIFLAGFKARISSVGHHRQEKYLSVCRLLKEQVRRHRCASQQCCHCVQGKNIHLL